MHTLYTHKSQITLFPGRNDTNLTISTHIILGEAQEHMAAKKHVRAAPLVSAVVVTDNVTELSARPLVEVRVKVAVEEPCMKKTPVKAESP